MSSDSAFAAARIPSITLRELIAQNLQRLRLDAAVSLDDLAAAAQRIGLDWNKAWLASVEKAAKPLSAEQLLALPIVLTKALGHTTALADLLLGEESVLLSNGTEAGSTPWTASSLRDVVIGMPFRRSFGASMPTAPTTVEEPSAAARAATKLRTITRAGLGEVDVRVLGRAEAGAGELEEKLARRLGVPPITVIAAAASLWGHSLTEERDAALADPAGGAAKQPAPTTVLRKLTAVLTARLSEAANRAAEETRAAAEAAEAAAASDAAAAAEAAEDSDPDETAESAA